MIIRRVRAENVLKFARLELDNLPERGVILLSGPNESGKTALAEILCLALFGRTRTAPPDHLMRAVRWGERGGSVEVVFQSGPKGYLYTVTRYLEPNGEQRARVMRALEGKRGRTIAKGAEETARVMRELLGYDFDRFQDTLYFTQGRDDRGTQGETVRWLTGLDRLEGAAATLDEEAAQSREALTELERGLEVLAQMRQTLGVRPETLGVLQSARGAATEQETTTAAAIARWSAFTQALEERTSQVERAGVALAGSGVETSLARWRERGDGLAKATTALMSLCHGGQVEMDAEPSAGPAKWVDGLWERLAGLEEILERAAHHRRRLLGWLGEPGETGDLPASGATLTGERGTLASALERARRGARTAGTLAGVCGLLAATAGGVWGGLSGLAGPELAQSLTSALVGAAGLGVDSALAAAGAGVGLTLAALLLLARMAGQRKAADRAEGEAEDLALREKQARRGAERIAEALGEEASPAEALARLAQVPDAPLGEDAARWAEAEGRSLVDEAARKEWTGRLESQLRAMRQEVDGLKREIAAQIAEDEGRLATVRREQGQLDGEIDRENRRRAEDAALQERLAAEGARQAAQARQWRIQTLARELLAGAGEELAPEFTKELRRWMEHSAPLLTQGRYRHVQLHDDLTLDLFAPERNDFVPLNELSTGVRGQVLLALRLALSQALAARAGAAPQFVLLDEPFAFADRERRREALRALPELHPGLTQYWVAGQEFDDDVPAAARIRCTREEDRLSWNGGGGP
ncbi:MAG: AAA family ATPase [Magnetococcales bacterium]|nr:AAA family ATPase [Magnetococcales bacterium]